MAATITLPTWLVERRVEIPTHYDAWMMGDRFGRIVRVTRFSAYVKLDRSGRTLRIPFTTLEGYGRYLD